MHLNLPKFFIYLDKYDKTIFEKYNTNIGIIYRNYQSKKREVELIRIAKACKQKRSQLFVSNDINLAIKVKAEGIYIPAFNKNKRFYNLEKKKLIVLGSAHNQLEIQKKLNKTVKLYFFLLFFM